MKKVIVFNGPARCGKDTAANVIHGLEPRRSRIVIFKEPLIKLAASFYGLTVKGFLTGYDTQLPYGKWHKDKPQRRLGLRSQRGALIHVSENVIKPVFGEAAFGAALARTIADDDDHDIFLVPDSGFEAELAPIKELFNTRVVHIIRPDCSFKGDSRSYLKNPDGVLHNPGGLEFFQDTVYYEFKHGGLKC